MPDWKEEIRRRLAELRLEPAREMEIVEELSGHIDDLYTELIARGASEAEARRATLTELSESESLRRELRSFEHRSDYDRVVPGEGRRNIMSDLWQDLRYGARMIMKNPGFTLIAAMTLALGIGANSAIFSLVNTVMFRPLPVENPDKMVSLNNTANNRTFSSFSYPNYKDFRDRSDVFSDLIAYRFAPLSLSYDGKSERLWGYEVTGNYSI